MAKANAVITHKINADGTIEFRVIGAETFTFNPAKASGPNNKRAALHGWIQRISDRGALGFNKTLNRYATAAEKAARMKAYVEFIEAGGVEWDMRAVKVEAGPDQTIIQGLCAVYGIEMDVMLAKLPGQAAARGQSVKEYLEACMLGTSPKADALRTTVAGIRASEAGMKADDDPLGDFDAADDETPDDETDPDPDPAE